MKALVFLTLLLILETLSGKSARAAENSPKPCPKRFAPIEGVHLGDFARMVANGRTRRAIDRMGFKFVGETRWGVAILDAKEFPRGGSGPVRMHVAHAMPDQETGLLVEVATVPDHLEYVRGTVILVSDPETDRIIFVAVPPGHETVDPEVSHFARQLIGHHRSVLKGP